MARHESASSKPDDTSVVNIENPTQAQDQDEFGGGRAGAITGATGQVVEVTNLLVPSGTDWSGGGFHTIGLVPVEFGQAAIATLYLEVAEPLDPADSVTLHTGIGAPAVGGISGAGLEPTGNVSDVIGVDIGFCIGTVLDPAPVVYMHTGGPTVADITIVAARITFFVV